MIQAVSIVPRRTFVSHRTSYKLQSESSFRDELVSRHLRAGEAVLHLLMMPTSKLPANERGSFLFGPPIRTRSRLPRSEGVQADR